MVSKFFEKQTTSGPLTQQNQETDLESEKDLPPIVARMVVEIRSDGTRTIARGALEDLQTGQRVSLKANAASPVALAKELSKTLLKTPSLASVFAKQAARDIIGTRLLTKISKLTKKNRG